MREVRQLSLPFREPVNGSIIEVELTSGSRISVFRADDHQFYFCHGLTFGGTAAPGGPVSPFSGYDVQTILSDFYQRIDPESDATPGDIVVWSGIGTDTPHSAILTDPIATVGQKYLDYHSLLRSKNGKLPEETLTLRTRVDGPESYGESYTVYRRK